jgi:alpha-tubulin suppressor-like RCC1 family protein
MSTASEHASAHRRGFALSSLVLVLLLVVQGCGDSSTSTPDHPTPTLSGISPSTTQEGGQAFTLTVTGSGFVEGSTVRWNGSARSTTVVSATQLTANIGAADIAQSGEAAVTVFTPAPGGGGSSALTFTITPVPVASVTVTPEQGEIVEGGTLQLSATPRSAAGDPLTGRTVTWSSDNEGVATVSGGGLVTSVAPGTVAISATSEGQSGAASITVVACCPVGPAGGVLTWAEGELVLEFPAGAVANTLTVSAEPNETPPASGALIEGTAWDLGPGGSTFQQAVTVRIRYDSGALPGGTETADLAIHRWTGAAWQLVPNGSVNAGTSTVSATTTSFSTFAILDTGGEDPGGPGGPTEGYGLIVAGADHHCALTVDGEARCWGWGDYGQLGIGQIADHTRPVVVSGGYTFGSMTAGYYHTCGLQASGQALCWGGNEEGAVGDGTTTDRLVPVPLAGGTTFHSIVAGGFHTCSLEPAGGAWCWGENEDGRLGDGTTQDRLVPTVVTGGHSFTQLALGGYHTCGLKEDGSAWCWGWNEEGQLGDGTTTDRSTPTPVTGGHSFVDIAAGDEHTCGLTAAGAVWCWGDNFWYQFGDGTDDSSPVPVATTGGHQFQQITAGTQHTCGLDSEGNAWCWGRGGAGRLGDGSTSNRTVPTPVSGGLTFHQIAAGDWNTCAITPEGVAWCWGWGPAVGHGTTENALVPTQVLEPAGNGAPNLTAPAAGSDTHPSGDPRGEQGKRR